MSFTSACKEIGLTVKFIHLLSGSFTASVLVTSRWLITLNTHASFCIWSFMEEGITLRARVVQILQREWGSGARSTLAPERQHLSPLSMGRYFSRKNTGVLNKWKKKRRWVLQGTAWMSITTPSLIFVNGLYISATGSCNSKEKYTSSPVISELGNAIQVKGWMSLPMIFTAVLPWLCGSTNYRYFQDLSELFRLDSLQGDLTVSQSLNGSKLRQWHWT